MTCRDLAIKSRRRREDW